MSYRISKSAGKNKTNQKQSKLRDNIYTSRKQQKHAFIINQGEKGHLFND